MEGSPSAFTIVISSESEQEFSVNWKTMPATATESADYRKAGGSVIFKLGETVASVHVNTINDEETEAESEYFEVMLYDPEGAILMDDLGRGTILDDEFKTNGKQMANSGVTQV